MKKKPLILIGAGGHASSCIEIINDINEYKIIGVIGLKNEVGQSINNIEIIGTDLDLPVIRKKVSNAFISIGQIQNFQLRSSIFKKLIDLEFNVPTLISKKSTVSKSVYIERGSIIMNGVFIGTNVKIGENCIINTGAIIEHGTCIEYGSHVSTGAIINGDCQIGRYTFIGSGAIIRQGAKISAESFIQMGEVIKTKSNITKK